jgi:16S rRNA (uracil1498-N3)-methyltransferase
MEMSGKYFAFAAHEKSDKRPDFTAADGQCCVFIGPEGGFGIEEADRLIEYNIETVSLGKRILRAETAAIAFAANFFYETDR